jgi:ubiquinol-cytochrome c reductase cytochrome c subunit
MLNRVLLGMQVTASLICAASAYAQSPASDDAVNGKRIYMSVGCYLCHGTVGQGSRPTGPHIAPNPLPYEVFAELVRRPVNVMPAYTTVVLSDQGVRDIYAYLLTIPPLPDSKAATILDH